MQKEISRYQQIRTLEAAQMKDDGQFLSESEKVWADSWRIAHHQLNQLPKEWITLAINVATPPQGRNRPQRSRVQSLVDIMNNVACNSTNEECRDELSGYDPQFESQLTVVAQVAMDQIGKGLYETVASTGLNGCWHSFMLRVDKMTRRRFAEHENPNPLSWNGCAKQVAKMFRGIAKLVEMQSRELTESSVY